jgi:hypothetical protein
MSADCSLRSVSRSVRVGRLWWAEGGARDPARLQDTPVATLPIPNVTAVAAVLARMSAHLRAARMHMSDGELAAVNYAVHDTLTRVGLITLLDV